jgi:hypothetical protein
MITKICSKFKTELPISDFYKDKYRKSGIKCICKSCEKKYREKFRLKRLCLFPTQKCRFRVT